MQITFRKKSEVWRGRGRPRQTIPPEVKELADATYRTGDAAVIDIDDDDREDADELCRLLRVYAKHRGLIMRINRDADQIRIEMADRPKKKDKA